MKLSKLLRTKLFLAILLLWGNMVLGQVHWETFSGNLFTNNATTMYFDSTDNSLYISGYYERQDGSREITNRIIRINQNKTIDTLPAFNGLRYVDAIIKWNGKLYVGGSDVFVLENNTWRKVDNSDPYAPAIGVYSFCEYKGNLIIGGVFIDSSFNGVHGESHVVSYDGTHFTRFMGEDSVISSGGIINSIVEYNGKLIIAGNFAGFPPMNSNYKEVVAWNGSNWLPLNHGIVGDGNELVYDMKVHNGELYVGGIFQESTGAPGNGLAKWDGSSWSNVGAGLGARHNWVYSILFNGDTMNLAGNFEVENVVHSPFARFINGQFCYDPDTVLWQGYCLGMLNNQVYLGGQVLWSSPTVQSTALAAYLGGDCFSPTSVKGTQQTLEFQLVPNPSLSGRFIVKVNAPFAMKDASIKVVNLTGQLIYQEQYINLGGSFSKEINLGNVAKGLYFVEFVSGGERVVKKLVLE